MQTLWLLEDDSGMHWVLNPPNLCPFFWFISFFLQRIILIVWQTNQPREIRYQLTICNHWFRRMIIRVAALFPQNKKKSRCTVVNQKYLHKNCDIQAGLNQWQWCLVVEGDQSQSNLSLKIEIERQGGLTTQVHTSNLANTKAQRRRKALTLTDDSSMHRSSLFRGRWFFFF